MQSMHPIVVFALTNSYLYYAQIEGDSVSHFSHETGNSLNKAIETVEFWPSRANILTFDLYIFNGVRTEKKSVDFR